MTPLPLLNRAQALSTHHDVLAEFQRRAQTVFATGEKVPFVWPYRAFGPYLLVLYLLIPPTKSRVVFYARYPIFIIVSYLSISAIIECRSATVTVGYGIGLLNAWALLWSATLLIFNDARGDFKRIEGRQQVAKGDCDKGLIHTDGSANATGTERSSSTKMRARKTAPSANGSANAPSSDAPRFIYQTLPPTFLHRLDWVADLVCNLRGVRWSHQISGLPPPPPHIQSSLADPSLPTPNRESHLTRSKLLWQNLPAFVLCLLALDGLKTLSRQDPYFWGLSASSPSPFPWPRLSRLLLSVTFTYVSLSTIFLLAPLGFGVLLGPERIGEHAWPWLYAPYFGSAREAARRGLAGVWGRWWQQLFRFGFEETGEFAGRMMGWEKGTQRGVALRVGVAFACSGLLHACASYSTLGKTKPLRAFAFFMVQPVGLFGQRAISGWMRARRWRERLPKWVRQVGNVMFVVVWFYVTGPLIADDFAASGIWLYEPLGFSLFGGLRGDHWAWKWSGTWVRWYRAEKWWQSGLAF